MKKFTPFSFLFFMISGYVFASPSPSFHHGMVVSEQKIASMVGADILRKGGNAVDAAVAIGYALAVVNPCCGNIGGGGFMTIHLANNKNIVINFREKAPKNAFSRMYVDGKQGQSETGFLAAGVPGTVLGFETALQKYGTLSRKEVMAPAIELAKKGFVVTPYDEKLFKMHAEDFRKDPSTARIFLKNGDIYHTGDRLVQTDLAHSLTQLSEKGADAFYKKDIAKTIVEANQSQGGILSLDDFAAYTVKEHAPIKCTYRGYTIISAPPPSSGGVTLCEMLNILEHFPLQQSSPQSTDTVRVMVEAMRYAYRDRNSKLGDPDFVNNPVRTLLSKHYAKQFSHYIKNHHQVVSVPYSARELTDTTHYSVLDRHGNAVSVTYSINGFFGARVIAGNTGFFLNNTMDDFAAAPGQSNKFGLIQYEKNEIQPEKRPLSSMAPTIVMKNGKIVMVIGSPGGPRIITAVLLALIHVIDHGMTIQEAVDMPRFHYQGLPDVIHLEPNALPKKTVDALKQLGYQLETQKTWAAVEAIWIDPVSGKIVGANDKRRPSGGAVKE